MPCNYLNGLGVPPENWGSTRNAARVAIDMRKTRAAALRGVLPMIQRRVARAIRIASERMRGLDFLSVTQPETAGCDPRTVHRSSPSGNKYLEAVLASLHITEGDSIIDIGCGKGSAMRTMLRFNFAEVAGIELSKQLADIATRNFTRLGAKRWRIYNANAVGFAHYGDYNMYYLYNPFPEAVMRRVLGDLTECARRQNGRRIRVIYNNPVAHRVILETQVFAKIAEHPDEWGNGIYVYGVE